MNRLTCPRCGNQNEPEIFFCPNCGESLATRQGGNSPSFNTSEPPPTMISYQPNMPMPAPGAPPNAPSQFSPYANPPAAPPAKKSNKGILFGLLGCGGLLLVSIIGLIVGIPLLQRAGVLPQPLFGKSSGPTIYDSNSNTYNSNSAGNVNSNTAPREDSDSQLLTELKSTKQIGSFEQTEAKNVVVKDYFPQATQAVQATYANGSQYVFWTIGKFPSSEMAKSNFETQIRNVKGEGGTILSNSVKETQVGAYKYKEAYFIETCSTDSCSRIHSNNLEALRSFSTSLGKKLSDSNSSSSGQQTDGKIEMVGVWKGKANNLPTTLTVTSQNGETFSGTFIQNDGTVVEFDGRINFETRSVSLKETKVIKQPKVGTWSLGDNNGTVSENGRSMSGKGQDNVNPPYTWSFTKQ